MKLNPFRDTTSNPRAEFKKQMAVPPENLGDPNSEERVTFSGSELTHKQYNDIFEGDSWSFSSKSTHTSVSLRPMNFQSGGDDTGKFEAKAEEGFLGTSLGAKRSHAHFVLGGGDDVVQHDGNSQRNISVVESGPGEKLIVQNLGGGDDKSVLFLNNTTGTIFVSGGDGDDELEIHSRSKDQTYTLIQDPEELPDPNDGYPGLRIVTQSVEKVREFK